MALLHYLGSQVPTAPETLRVSEALRASGALRALGALPPYFKFYWGPWGTNPLFLCFMGPQDPL